MARSVTADFDGNGTVDATGRTAEWTFGVAGAFTVVLTISDGIRSAEASRTVDVVEASAEAPTATIGLDASSEFDCLGEDVSASSYILIWICEDDKETSDRRISATTTVALTQANPRRPRPTTTSPNGRGTLHRPRTTMATVIQRTTPIWTARPWTGRPWRRVNTKSC